MSKQDVQKKLESLKTEFDSIGSKWRSLRVETGRFLLKAKEQLGDTGLRMLMKWIKKVYKITEVEQKVCIRMATGELPSEIADFGPASIMSKIETQNLPDLDQEYEIYSPSAGGVIKKKPRHWDREEKRINLGVHGVKSIDESFKFNEKPVLTAIAASHRIEKDTLVLFVPSLNKEVKYLITPKLVADVTKACRKLA